MVKGEFYPGDLAGLNHLQPGSVVAGLRRPFTLSGKNRADSMKARVTARVGIGMELARAALSYAPYLTSRPSINAFIGADRAVLYSPPPEE
jgi:hypothetical protein